MRNHLIVTIIFLFFNTIAQAQTEAQTVTTTELKEQCKQEGKIGKELLACIQEKIEESKKGSSDSIPKND